VVEAFDLRAGENRFMVCSSPAPAFWSTLATGGWRKGGSIPRGSTSRCAIRTRDAGWH